MIKIGSEVIKVGFSWRITDWFQDLDQSLVDCLFEYASILYNFNQSLNLVSRQTEKSLDQVHIADCLLAAQTVLSEAPASERIFDIGSGNGLPGIVLGILDRNREIVLVERDQRKADFLKIAISRLGLRNIRVLAGSVESLERETIKCAVSRGFAALSLALVKVRPLCASGCKYFHMKGENWARELAQAPAQVFTHWNVEVRGSYELPGDGDHGPLFVVLSQLRK